jgi:replicative DNA helicase
MQEPKLIDRAAETVEARHFFEPLHGRIFSAILAQHAAGKRANPVTLRPFFEQDEAMREVGGPAYLAQLTGSGAAIIGALDFAGQVRELSQRRTFIEGLQRSIAAASDCDKPLEALAVLADDAASAVHDATDAGGEYSAAEALQGVIDQMDKPVTGARCGVIPSIDALLGPMRPTHLVIGAGRPGMGKTATAISYALGAAKRGHGVLFISLEMGAEQLAERMAADLCHAKGIPYAAIRDRVLTTDQKREVCRAHETIRELPLQILDKSGLSLGQVRRYVKRWKRRFAARKVKLELVIVDYLQLMGGDTSNGRFELVSEISRGLKSIAKDEGLCVFALSQLSRKVEERPDKRPTLSDLRESGQIEQDADAVLFFLRLEYYLRQSEPSPESGEKRAKWERDLEACRNVIEFICAKRRNGSSGSRCGQFLAEFQAVRG